MRIFPGTYLAATLAVSDEEHPISYVDLHIDPYAPHEMADRAQRVGAAKARMDFLDLFTLGVLAGAFVSLGAQFATVAFTGVDLGYGLNRMIFGLAFSLGLILIVVGGAELFTGNTLIVMAWVGHKITWLQVLRVWTIVFVANFVGAMLTVLLIYASGQFAFAGNLVGANALLIANSKANLGFLDALIRGILANGMVVLAVWLCFSARSVVDKVSVIIPPIVGFAAAGFEHSIANMYFIPMGLLLKDQPAVVAASGLLPEALANLTWYNFVVRNLIPVTIGNIIGGAVLVGAAYWLVYLRHKTPLDLARLIEVNPGDEPPRK